MTTKVTKGETPLWKGDKYQKSGVLFIKSENVLINELALSEKVFINVEVHERMKRSQLRKGDVLFNIVGASIGRACVFTLEEEANINQAVCLIRVNERVNPFWLSFLLNSTPFQTLFEQIKSGGSRDNIDLYQVKELQIPLPPLDIQQQLVEIMNTAYAQKQQHEQEAAALLHSIDGYVLQELGISLPEIKEQKVFAVNLADIEDRLDPFHYQPKFLQKYACLRNGKYPAVQLGSVMLNLLNGKEFRTYSEKGFRYLRVTDLGEHGINNNSPRYIDIPEIPSSIRLSPNDFLISRSGSLGLVSVVADEISDAVLSSHIFKVLLDTQTVLPSYVQAFLRSSIGQFQFFHKNNGGIIPEINQPALKSIEIVLPPLEVQNRLAAEVAARMTSANALQAAAQAVVAQAKAEVERLLFA